LTLSVTGHWESGLTYDHKTVSDIIRYTSGMKGARFLVGKS